ncbi:Organic hydroperoxide reductase OsmC/OhrA [Maribacter sedimenticola]|uniref:Organic hydroperoxide reductase OsmC/OhrA n=2 Tax=Maribacter sedimenticola TaxID=228956 RepID=A0ABY1SGI6_9FLAO|nr:Organic hydroperoxide reductase OsmC/OhrA [Maribacter sedimenticola]
MKHIALKMKHHNYQTQVTWTGNQGQGTLNYASYSRDHEIMVAEKYDAIQGSSDPSFLGDKSKYNPEDLFLSSLSSCHMLWFLHLCSVHKIVVTSYVDNAKGTMEESVDGSGKFTMVTLNPIVTITDGTLTALANSLHEKANRMCFIANSCNFTVHHQPTTLVG